jgi:hypothetical protein
MLPPTMVWPKQVLIVFLSSWKAKPLPALVAALLALILLAGRRFVFRQRVVGVQSGRVYSKYNQQGQRNVKFVLEIHRASLGNPVHHTERVGHCFGVSNIRRFRALPQE